MITGRPKSLIKRIKSSVYITNDSFNELSEIAKNRGLAKNAVFQEAVNFYLSQNKLIQSKN